MGNGFGEPGYEFPATAYARYQMMPTANEIVVCDEPRPPWRESASAQPSATTAAITSPELLAWLTPDRFSLLLAAFSLAMFPEVWLGTRTFFVRDFGIFSYPLAHYFRESFWRGEIPLWNPLNNCGIPFLAQWNTMVCYPFSIFYLTLPLSWSLGVFCLLHQILAGAGMFVLTHRWTNHRLAAGLAGVAFAFNGMTLNCLIWPHIMAALGWMPWVILALDEALESGGRRALLAALVGAFQMLAGGPEVVIFTWLIATGLLVLKLLHESSARQKRLRCFAAVAALVAALSAIQLAPFFDLLFHSQRNTGYATAVSSLPATGWLNFLAPLFHCFKSPLGVYFQPEQFWTTSYYLGIGATALALAAVFISRDSRARPLAIATVFALLLALGDHTPIYGVLKNCFPALSFMNYPVKFVLVAVFCVPLLGAMALKEFFATNPAHKTKPARAIFWIGLLVCSTMIGLVVFAQRSPTTPGEWRVVASNAAARVVFLAACLGLLAALKRNLSARAGNLLGVALLALAWLDAATHAPSQNPTVPRAVYEAGATVAMNLKPPPRAGESRAALSRTAQEQFEKCLVADPLQSYLGPRLALFSDGNLLDGIPKIDGFFPLFVREEHEVLKQVTAKSTGAAEPWRDFVGVSQFIPEGKLFEWTPRSAAMPLITAGQKPVFADEAVTLAAMGSASFAPVREVFLPLAARNSLVGVNASTAKILSQKFSAHRIEAEIEAPAAAMVVVAQTFYHAWHARVDGQPAQLWRANHAYQAVVVPGGRHRVELVYKDRAFAVGAALSAVTLAFIALLWFGKSSRSLKNNSSSTPALFVR
ncbi:MAG: YfhO family protein [Verrucomicrobia bacterium]|nr:YfhO family protein [Verrucomicrobiota bacterium]